MQQPPVVVEQGVTQESMCHNRAELFDLTAQSFLMNDAPLLSLLLKPVAELFDPRSGYPRSFTREQDPRCTFLYEPVIDYQDLEMQRHSKMRS